MPWRWYVLFCGEVHLPVSNWGMRFPDSFRGDLDTGIVCGNAFCAGGDPHGADRQSAAEKSTGPYDSICPQYCKAGHLSDDFAIYLFYIGLAHNSGVKASIINGSNTFFVILVSALIFRQEKLDLKKVLGCIMVLPVLS